MSGSNATALPLLNYLLYPSKRLSQADDIVEAHLLFGVCSYETGDPTTARREFEEALDLQIDLELDPVAVAHARPVNLPRQRTDEMNPQPAGGAIGERGFCVRRRPGSGIERRRVVFQLVAHSSLRPVERDPERHLARAGSVARDVRSELVVDHQQVAQRALGHPLLARPELDLAGHLRHGGDRRWSDAMQGLRHGRRG